MSKFSKRHFELIAESINRSRFVAEMDKNSERREAKLDALRLAANDLAGTMKGDNSRFDTVRFLTACGF